MQKWTQRTLHNQHTLVCSTFDFTSSYTNPTWHSLLRTWEWWKKWYNFLLDSDVGGAAYKEKNAR